MSLQGASTIQTDPSYTKLLHKSDISFQQLGTKVSNQIQTTDQDSRQALNLDIPTNIYTHHEAKRASLRASQNSK